MPFTSFVSNAEKFLRSVVSRPSDSDHTVHLLERDQFRETKKFYCGYNLLDRFITPTLVNLDCGVLPVGCSLVELLLVEVYANWGCEGCFGS